MAEEKRVKKGTEALGKVIEQTMKSLPELAQNKDALKPFLESVAMEAGRLAVRSDETPYEEYKDVKSTLKTLVNTATDKAANELGLSASVANKLKLGIGGITELAVKGELEIPETTLYSGKSGSAPYSVSASGYVNPERNIYDVKTKATVQEPFKDMFGIEGGSVSLEAKSNYDRMLADFNIGASIPTGKTSDISFGVSADPDRVEDTARARLGFSAKFKKGGKVSKKKKKSKSYAKGCVVRTANY